MDFCITNAVYKQISFIIYQVSRVLVQTIDKTRVLFIREQYANFYVSFTLFRIYGLSSTVPIDV
ncbi:hypothetical protein T4D_14889 [Trichinella pseudospiralis]|uniref:Uncharacterized protein n=1 Tax=Trichinella pseudospiralis TaxID=6337 RepID=A0A0V1FA16_TRIPS|nr:hypothetical protein T4D_14889 [Trichinella pseudospiralis]